MYCLAFHIARISAAESLVGIFLFNNFFRLIFDATGVCGTPWPTLDLRLQNESLSLKRPEVTVFDGTADDIIIFVSPSIENICPAKWNVVYVNDFAKADDTCIFVSLIFSF